MTTQNRAGSPAETDAITYLSPPGNQGDVAPFLEDLGLRQRDGVGLHGNVLH